MVLYRSREADIPIPEDLTVWEWLFESEEHSVLHTIRDRPLGAFIDAVTKERINWAEAQFKSTALSTCLIREYGLSPGDTVSLFSTNTVWYPVCQFAISRAGGRINGASPAYTIDEMVHCLKIAKTKILVTIPAALTNALAAAEKVGIPRSHVVLMHGEVEGFKNVQTLIQQGLDWSPRPYYRVPEGKTNKEICGYLNFSSGTTGLPKAVMLSHHNVIAQCIVVRARQEAPETLSILSVTPLYHITGTWRMCCYPICVNAPLVMLPSFNMRTMLQAIVDYKIRELPLVPPIFIRLIRDPIVLEYDLRCVTLFASSAAPLSLEVVKAFHQRFPWARFRQGYGATEAPCLAMHPSTHYDTKYGTSVGMFLPNVVAKVIDTNGNELGPGQQGEILAKGPQVSMGYLDNEKATTESFGTDGFYHTGDVGYVDEEGLIYIKDRIKEMIKVKGTQVPPAELEDLLLGHEDVDDCGVIGQPDEYAGELPKAYVVLKNHAVQSDETGRRLLDYVKQNKVRYKWLVAVEFVDSIPKSPAGKILRKELRDADRERQKTGVTLGHLVQDGDKTKHRKQNSLSGIKIDQSVVVKKEEAVAVVKQVEEATVVKEEVKFTHRQQKSESFKAPVIEVVEVTSVEA